MNDLIFQGWLESQYREGTELAAQSDLVDLEPLPESALPGDETPCAYIAKFYCKGLVRSSGGGVVEASEFHVGIRFAANHLRQVDPFQVLCLMFPENLWHPNIRWPFICAGRIGPGCELVDLIYQCFEIITYQNWAAHDGLNHEACQWARQNQDRFPIDRRPLKRRALTLNVSNDTAEDSSP